MSRTHRKHGNGGVIAVDQNMMPLSEISRRRAIKAVVTGKACILDLRTWMRQGPEVLSGLRSLDVVIFPNVKAIPDSRMGLGRGNRAILRRDGYRCAYCGGKANSVDHVMPKAQGGKTEATNLIAACTPCNNRKGPRTPDGAKMPLLFRPRSPRWALVERIQALAAAAAS